MSLFQSRSKRSADADLQADDATYVSTYANHHLPLTYTAGYPAHTAYSAPTFYNSYNPLAYHNCNGVHGCTVYPAFHGYTAPVVHSIKKRDTATAEADQEGSDATYVSTYAAHPFNGYAGYGYQPFTTYSAAHQVPTVYNTGAAVTYPGFAYPGYQYNTYRTFY